MYNKGLLTYVHRMWFVPPWLTQIHTHIHTHTQTYIDRHTHTDRHTRRHKTTFNLLYY